MLVLRFNTVKLFVLMSTSCLAAQRKGIRQCVAAVPATLTNAFVPPQRQVLVRASRTRNGADAYFTTKVIFEPGGGAWVLKPMDRDTYPLDIKLFPYGGAIYGEVWTPAPNSRLAAGPCFPC